MAFDNAYSSHAHSRCILDLLYSYDSFLDSLSVIADFGCGAGLDVEWWATLTTREDPPEPRNYLVYGVDREIQQVDTAVKSMSNVKLIQADFEADISIPRACDLLWSHDSFQYCTNPLYTLNLWNQQINDNGMLVLSIPQSTYYSYNRLQNVSHSHVYFNYNIVGLMYMLAVNGFDCKDAYFCKNANDPWMYAAVYKATQPMDPKTTSWHTLAEMNLVNDSVKESLQKYNYVTQDDLLVTWLDKDYRRLNE